MIVQVPAERNVSAPPALIEQTPDVDELKVTASPELDVAVSVRVVPNVWAPGFANVIVWVPLLTARKTVTVCAAA